MTETQFSKLEKRQRADIVWEWGYYLGSRKSTHHIIALFLIGDFFCEVYIRLDNNKTEEINPVPFQNLHTDFMSSLNPANPLIKAAIEKHSRRENA